MEDEYLGMIRELLAIESGLTPWETDFLDSLFAQTDECDVENLSPKQKGKLRQIWVRIFK